MRTLVGDKRDWLGNMPQYRNTGRPHWRRALPLAAIFGCALALSGCATAVIGSVTVSQISAAAGIASAATTGKGLQDHALSAITGQDCRLLEGIFRSNRHICEEPGSPATEHDFRGVVVMLLGPPQDSDTPAAEPEVTYAGLASDYRPSLTRRARQPAEVEAAAEVRTVAYQPAVLAAPLQLAQPIVFAPNRPSIRPTPVEETDTSEQLVVASLYDNAPPLVRTARRSGGTQNLYMAARDREPLPRISDWADARPAPTIASVRLALD